MANPFLAEIVMFGSNFAPRGWALTDGQLLAISSNSALFSLLGTAYGGDGRTTFGLPDLRGRSPLHAGHGPGLSSIRLGQKGGTQQFTVRTNEMPSHNHSLVAERGPASTPSPDNAMLAAQTVPAFKPYNSANGEFLMASQSMGNTGGGQPITKVSPFTAVNFLIALQGIFPSRS